MERGAGGIQEAEVSERDVVSREDDRLALLLLVAVSDVRAPAALVLVGNRLGVECKVRPTNASGTRIVSSSWSFPM